MSGTDYTQTPNLGLFKPNYDMDAEQWGLHLNENADVLDAAFSPTGGVFLPINGGEMNGMLTLFGPPANPLDAATKSYVDSQITSGIPGASTTLPLMSGTALVGSGLTWARADHVHPSDTSRYAATNPAGYQTAAQVTTSLGAYLPLVGGTVTGALTINGSPTALTIANGAIAIPTNQQLQGRTWLAVGQNKALVNSGALSPVIGATIGAISGTITGSGVTSFYSFINGSDNADASGISNQLALVKIGYSYGGTALRGGRVALTVQSGQVAPASASEGNPFYSVCNFWQTLNYNEGGTAPTIGLSRGQAVGLNPQLVASPGATNFTEMSLAEWNIVVQAGASTARKFGIKISPLSNDAVQGTVSDAALKFGGASPIGWKNLILFGGDISTWSGTGNIMSGQVSTGTGGRQPAARRGLSLEQIALPAITTSNASDGFLRSNAFTVDGLGVTQIGTAYLTPQSTGLALDLKGIVGSTAVVAAGGSGYFAGDFLFDPWGGIYTVVTAPGSVVATVAVYTDANGNTRWPYYPGTTPPANPVAVTTWGTGIGSGCTLTLSWDTSRSTLALNPSGGPTTIGGDLTVTGTLTSAGGSFAPLASPVFTGNPTAPTPAPGDNDASLATTAFVTAALPAPALPLIGGTVTGVTTFSAAGTALSVTNNATVGAVVTVGSGSNAILTITPGAALSNAITLTSSGTAGITVGGVACAGNNVTCSNATFSGAVRHNGTVGFNNTAAIAKPTVSGAKGSNAALASLMTALAAYGLVTDSTSA